MSSSRPVNRVEMGTSKMLPFMNNHSSSNCSASANYGARHLYDTSSLGLGMSGLGVGIGGDGGIGGNHMGGNHMSYLSGQNGSLNHMSANKPPSKLDFKILLAQKLQWFTCRLVAGYNTGMSMGNHMYNNGSSSHNNYGLGTSIMAADQGPCMKDWQDGLRALFPNVNISMGNGSVTNNGSNSRMGAFPPGLTGLGNGQQHQMAQQQTNLASKGWRSNVTDWTSLDPAIVSSGQITDSRSDSPPHWLRSLEQLTESSPAQPPTNSSNLFGLTNSTHYSLPSLAARNNITTPGLDGLNTMGSFWPPSVSHTTPSMPPPGFSHIRPSPKTAATADTQKLDSKSSVYHGISKVR